MESEYALFVGGLLALVGGFFGMSTTAAIGVAVVFGLVSVGTVGLVAMAVVFFMSFLGAVAAYLWFVAGLEE